MKDPTLAAQKWAANLTRSADAIRAGVNSVTEAPTAKAARSLDKALTNYAESINSGRTARALGNVTLQDWQQAMLTTGLARIQSGAQKGQSKYQKFATAFFPVMDQASKTAQAMPKNTLEDSLARVRVVMEAARRFAGKGM